MPLAKAAVDVAMYDLLGKVLGLPVYALLGGKRVDTIQLAWIVSSEGPGGAEASVAEGRGRGYRAFKVKIGLHGERDDVRTVEWVRAAAGEDAFLWVDANQSYTVDVALRVARELEHLGVAAFEQPLPANDIDGLGYERIAQLRRPESLYQILNACLSGHLMSRRTRLRRRRWCRREVGAERRPAIAGISGSHGR
jgi:muconate cycloisomerase